MNESRGECCSAFVGSVACSAPRHSPMPLASQDGSTPLILVAINGKLDVCQFLVASGADVHKADNVTRRDERGPQFD